MKLPNIQGLVSVVKTFAVANRPEILLGVAITATVGSTVLAAKGGYEARGLVDAKEAELGRKTDVKEKIQLTWLCYIPATIACTTALGSTAGLHLVHVKEKKQLATAAMAAIEELKAEGAKLVSADNALEEVAGPDGTLEIQSSDHDVEELYLVRDGLTGRDIWSNQHRIEDALIEVNNTINGSGSCELNHFYQHAGFNRVNLGLELGWSGVLPSLEWKETKRDDGRPVREFVFRPAPTKGYDDAHQ